ncbi:MAG: nucleotidyltransferase [Bacteroidota bacterium]
MQQLPNDFKEFLRLLNFHKAEYLLIGGYAVGYYGYPRVTGDIDIWIAINSSNSQKISLALKDFGFTIDTDTAQNFMQENKIVRMGIPPMRIEIFTSISGVTFEECFREKNIVDIEGVKISMINLKHLLLNKKASGRHKDLNDLENLS